MRQGDLLRFLRGIARKNPWQKVSALLLSTLLWWFVAGESKVQVGMVVPVEIRNIPAGTTVSNKVERQAEVRLSGPSSILSNLSQSDVSANIDLASARPGRQVIALDARSVRVPPGVKVQRVYPSALEVVLSRLERRSLPVVPRIGGSASVRRRIARITVEPQAVEVEGLAEDFERLTRLQTEEVVPEVRRGTFVASVRVDLREGHAKIVGDPVVRVAIQFRD